MAPATALVAPAGDARSLRTLGRWVHQIFSVQEPLAGGAGFDRLEPGQDVGQLRRQGHVASLAYAVDDRDNGDAATALHRLVARQDALGNSLGQVYARLIVVGQLLLDFGNPRG